MFIVMHGQQAVTEFAHEADASNYCREFNIVFSLGLFYVEV